MEEQTKETIIESKRGMSNTSLALLILFVMVISIIGTWVVVNSIYTVSETPVAKPINTNSATVNLNIKQPPTIQDSLTTGKVTLNIQRP